MKNQKDKIFFPENTSEIIFRLIKKYQLEEPDETILDRLRAGKKLMGVEMIQLLREIKEGLFNKKSLSLELEKRLGIDKTKAENLRENIEDNFFRLESEGEIEEIMTRPRPQKSDEYREPIE